ncbi:2,3-bisphosphoglycerate-independent phosphoglycerate mutase [Garciella nitratireducens]|uniref:2,3-bisphosphoglycerate-independent phosphoglycerate mutase n=1 Tax=Garciella nitratireducens DSM 15102 TaxID=1121911 RepID=A0A1T4KLH2_9FIRM|nr:2,3-bisphosphoglycerate-independent phosphoglycerate mutase [Garciella nitratireducens]SJZ43256.1 phosphoglycerate mutase [Garciella nitratireducens DSM 15102]
MPKGITALIILDGLGYSTKQKGNAVKEAKTENLKKLWEKYPHTFLQASGLAVGLPEGQMGNSEVGHLNLGAGRIVYQELTRITKSIQDGSFFENPAFLKAIENVKKNNSALHLLGLVSDGGVHSHNTHLYALLELAKKEGIHNVYIHCFLDGRDTPPKSAEGYLSQLEKEIKKIGVGKIATIAGRYYAMDRDKRWERTQLAYEAMVLAKGEYASSSEQAIQQAYHDNTTDEFVLPTIIQNQQGPIATIKEKDSVIFFNFRPDRARQITRALVDKDFEGFQREKGYFPLTFVTMTQYDKTIENVDIAYLPQKIDNTLGEYISQEGMQQLRIAETEKYAHVTYFFNGGVEKQLKGEDRVLVPSPKVATYDLQPEMSAYQVTDKVLKAVDSEKYDFMVLNYANADMVGHTGVFEAAVKAIETVDDCVGKVVEAILRNGGKIIVTADHGNAEQMLDYHTKKPHTAHTSNLVPCIVAGAGDLNLKEGKLADIAPTLLDLMNLEKPEEMTGESIIL